MPVHFATPFAEYGFRGFPNSTKRTRFTLAFGPEYAPHFVDVVPDLTPDPVSAALLAGRELPGGVVRTRRAIEGRRNLVELDGTKIVVTPKGGNGEPVVRHWMPLVRLYPKGEKAGDYRTSIAHLSEWDCFVVLIEFKPKTAGEPAISVLKGVVIPENDVAGRWKRFHLNAEMTVDHARWFRDEEKYGLFVHRSKIYWSVPQAKVAHVQGARRVFVVRSIPATVEEPVEIEVFGPPSVPLSQ